MNSNCHPLITLDTARYETEVFNKFDANDKYFSFEYVLPEFSDCLVNILEKLNRIDSIKINYSKGKSKLLQLYNWADYHTFLNAINNDEKFISSMESFGEIHVTFAA